MDKRDVLDLDNDGLGAFRIEGLVRNFSLGELIKGSAKIKTEHSTFFCRLDSEFLQLWLVMGIQDQDGFVIQQEKTEMTDIKLKDLYQECLNAIMIFLFGLKKDFNFEKE